MYALELAREDPVDTQISAVTELSNYPTLDAGEHVTVVQMDQHLNGLFSK